VIPPKTPDSTGFYEDPETGETRCYTCGRLNLDHDFGEFLAHLLEEPLEEGRRLQAKIVKRLEDGL
jgi:hypothetical protein